MSKQIVWALGLNQIQKQSSSITTNKIAYLNKLNPETLRIQKEKLRKTAFHHSTSVFNLVFFKSQRAQWRTRFHFHRLVTQNHYQNSNWLSCAHATMKENGIEIKKLTRFEASITNRYEPILKLLPFSFLRELPNRYETLKLIRELKRGIKNKGWLRCVLMPVWTVLRLICLAASSRESESCRFWEKIASLEERTENESGRMKKTQLNRDLQSICKVRFLFWNACEIHMKFGG